MNSRREWGDRVPLLVINFAHGRGMYFSQWVFFFFSLDVISMGWARDGGMDIDGSSWQATWVMNGVCVSFGVKWGT